MINHERIKFNAINFNFGLRWPTFLGIWFTKKKYINTLFDIRQSPDFRLTSFDFEMAPFLGLKFEIKFN